MAWEWTEEELVLACALVRDNNWRGLYANDPRVKALSVLLREMTLHPLEGRPDAFRSVASVQSKTWDLATHHPDYSGEPTHGDRLDSEVLKRFLDSEFDLDLQDGSINENLNTTATPSPSMTVTSAPSPPAPTRKVWTVEEMILAADVADELSWGPVNAKTPDVIALSELLRSAEIHAGASVDPKFRSPGSVGMKINNLRASHPTHSGKGLRSSKAEEPIVRNFVEDRAAMKDSAVEIRRRIAFSSRPNYVLPTPDEELIDAATEGGARAVRTLRRERNPKLRRAKIAQTVAMGRSIACEVCAFDFGRQYGEHGVGYIEVHHKLPLHVSGAITTTLDDLVLLCANCHRMVHNGGWLTVEELREMHRLQRSAVHELDTRPAGPQVGGADALTE